MSGEDNRNDKNTESGGGSLGGGSAEPGSDLSVQNPKSSSTGGIVQELLERAAMDPEPFPSDQSGNQKLAGEGQTVGNDEVESTHNPSPDAEEGRAVEEHAIRQLTFWRNGFAVGDGKFYRYGDPLNRPILEEIQAGRAPPSVFNVKPGELVEVRVAQRTNEDYTQLPVISPSSALRSSQPKDQSVQGPGSKPSFMRDVLTQCLAMFS